MTNEQRKKIVENAPKGATHYDQGEYMRCVDVCKWEFYSNYDDSWGDTEPESDTRNLADLRAIVERDERIAELERELEEPVNNDWYEKLCLAQQAKGIEDAIHNSPSRLEYAIPLVSTLELYSYAEQLRKRAGES